jgi:hypothetical protein
MLYIFLKEVMGRFELELVYRNIGKGRRILVAK